MFKDRREEEEKKKVLKNSLCSYCDDLEEKFRFNYPGASEKGVQGKQLVRNLTTLFCLKIYSNI